MIWFKEHDILRRVMMRVGFRLTDHGLCWLINSGWSDGKGYYKISIGGHGYYCHVLMYWLFRGRFGRTKDLDHICQQRNCCNPYHLQPLTRKKHNRKTHGRKRNG